VACQLHLAEVLASPQTAVSKESTFSDPFLPDHFQTIQPCLTVAAIESHARGSRNKNGIASEPHSRSAPIQTPISSVMAVNKHAALPILISTAAIQSSDARVVAVDEHVRFSSQAHSSSASLGESRH